jgi:hypothetical protein
VEIKGDWTDAQPAVSEAKAKAEKAVLVRLKNPILGKMVDATGR